ncbi:RDD [actinobacterium SCGC AAA044-D11]
MVNEANDVTAGTGRRFLALMIDWFMCLLIASLLGFESKAFVTLVIFFIEVSVLTILQQASAGQRILRLRVVDFTTFGIVPVRKIVLRTFLICLVLPAVFTREGRGLHDWVANSVVVKSLRANN